MNRLVILCIAFVNLSVASSAEMTGSSDLAEPSPQIEETPAPVEASYSMDLLKKKMSELPREQLVGVVAAAVALRLLLAYSLDESAMSVILTTAAGASLANPDIRSKGSQLLRQILRRAKRMD